jgi:TolB-like protein
MDQKMNVYRLFVQCLMALVLLGVPGTVLAAENSGWVENTPEPKANATKAASKAKGGVLVQPVQMPPGVDAAFSVALQSTLAAAAQMSGVFERVVNATDLARLMKEADGEEQTKAVAAGMDQQYILKPTLQKSGEKLTLNLKLTDHKRSKVVGRSSVEYASIGLVIAGVSAQFTQTVSELKGGQDGDEVMDEKPSLALLGIQLAQGLNSADAKPLSERLLTRLGNTKRFNTLIGGSDIQDLVSFEQQKAAVGCDADSCVTELAGALGVRFVMVVATSPVGSKFQVVLKILDVEQARAAVRLTQEISKAADLRSALDDLTDEAVLSLFRNLTVLDPEALAKREANRVIRLVSVAASVVGLAAMAGGYWMRAEAQDTHQREQNDVSFDQLQDAAVYSNLVWLGGLAITGAGSTVYLLNR